MSVIRPTTVEVETSLRLVAPDATALPVRASLRYDPSDPYAVHVLFHAETDRGRGRELVVRAGTAGHRARRAGRDRRRPGVAVGHAEG